MPLQDADKPSRRQALAAEHRKHGAYDPVRLAKLLPHAKLSVRKRGQAAFSMKSRSASRSTLWKRDVAPSSAGGAPPNPVDPILAASQVNTTTTSPSAATDDDPSSPLPSNISQINYGDAKANKLSPPADYSTMHNDTMSAPSLDQNQSLAATGTSSRSKVTDDSDSVLNGDTIGLVVGAMIIVAVLVAIGFIVRRRRQIPGFCRKPSNKRTKAQRLGSIDGLRSISTGGSRHDKAEAREDKFGSSNSLLVSPVSPARAGPFDRAISNMLSPSSPPNNTLKQNGKLDVYQTNTFLRVPLSSSAGLSHQRSLDSIAEVQEPTSADVTKKRDSFGVHSDSTPPKRLTWTERLQQPSRPTTSPGGSGGSFGSLSPASTFGTRESKSSNKSSPPRPQSAKGSGGDIEMTRQGSTLVIRNRPSTATLRRPLSSAGSSFRSALRKKGDEDEAICIETDGIVERRRPMTSPTAEGAKEAVYDLPVPTVTVDKSQLRSHFSVSSNQPSQSQRGSIATVTTASPSGSFSFEIKDAVRLRAPVTLESSSSASSSSGEGWRKDGAGSVADLVAAAANTGHVGLVGAASTESFIRDLDWDVRDCGLSYDERCTTTPPALPPQQQADEPRTKAK